MTNNEELQVIKTVGENGEEIELKLLDIVNVNNVDYALLLPADEEADEEAEVVLMRLIKEGDEYLFETIDDDDEFNEVAKILAEEEDEDEEEDN
ncbi:TPA: DUF1292 domain-containing protein [Candidatus Galligastranaerophilus gallistercoris]|nr:DUF1292 domain-containing protein [Candidatus Galligastranaerophilus gallistercoris]